GKFRTHSGGGRVRGGCFGCGAVAFCLLPPLHHVRLAPVFLDQLGNAVAPLASALRAFDAERVEFALDITEDEISPGRHQRPQSSSSSRLTARTRRGAVAVAASVALEAAASAVETSISPVLSRPNRFRAARNWRSAF